MTTRARRPPPSPFDEWSEAQLQAKIEGFAIKHGWGYFHPFDSRRSRKGWPDVTLWHPERRLTIFAELKSATGKPTPAQRKVLEGLARAGNYVYVWYPRHWPLIMDLLSGVEDPVSPYPTHRSGHGGL